MLFTLFLLYPGLSSKVIGHFHCINVDGTSYLMADMTISCSDHEYLSFLPYAIFMTILVGFLFMVLCLFYI